MRSGRHGAGKPKAGAGHYGRSRVSHRYRNHSKRPATTSGIHTWKSGAGKTSRQSKLLSSRISIFSKITSWKKYPSPTIAERHRRAGWVGVQQRLPRPLSAPSWPRQRASSAMLGAEVTKRAAEVRRSQRLSWRPLPSCALRSISWLRVRP